MQKPRKEPISLGYHRIAEDDDVLIGREQLAQELLRTFRQPHYQAPMLPYEAMQIMQLTQKVDVRLEQVEAVLERDPLLAAKVLQIARSPLYAGKTPIRSLHQAVVRLGLRTVRDIVMQASLSMRVFRAAGYQETLTQLHRHSVAVGHIARIIAQYTSIERDYAFLCGILHDVGIAALLIALGERYKSRPDLEVVWPAIDVAHQEASGLLCEIWDLPGDLRTIVSCHHNLYDDGYPHPLAAIVLLANDHAHAIGIGVAQDHDHSIAALIPRAKDQLRLTPSLWHAILDDIDRQADALEEQLAF